VDWLSCVGLLEQELCFVVLCCVVIVLFCFVLFCIVLFCFGLPGGGVEGITQAD